MKKKIPRHTKLNVTILGRSPTLLQQSNEEPNQAKHVRASACLGLHGIISILCVNKDLRTDVDW